MTEEIKDMASEPDFEAADEVAATMAPMVARLTRENAALKAEVERLTARVEELEEHGPTPFTDKIAARGRKIIEERFITENAALKAEVGQLKAERHELRHALEACMDSLYAEMGGMLQYAKTDASKAYQAGCAVLGPKLPKEEREKN